MGRKSIKENKNVYQKARDELGWSRKKAADEILNVENGKYGYVNTKGEVVVPCIYDNTWWFSEGFARVEQNDKSGFINTQGEVVIPCIYDNADDFFEGLAKVKQNDKGSIFNKKGKVIVAECDKWETHWSRVEME